MFIRPSLRFLEVGRPLGRETLDAVRRERPILPVYH